MYTEELRNLMENVRLRLQLQQNVLYLTLAAMGAFVAFVGALFVVTTDAVTGVKSIAALKSWQIYGLEGLPWLFIALLSRYLIESTCVDVAVQALKDWASRTEAWTTLHAITLLNVQRRKTTFKAFASFVYVLFFAPIVASLFIVLDFLGTKGKLAVVEPTCIFFWVDVVGVLGILVMSIHIRLVKRINKPTTKI